MYALLISWLCFEDCLAYRSCYTKTISSMAILTNGPGFTGRLQNMTAYKMNGSDKIILRAKGGASKNKVLHSPSFARTRENFTEFGGCARATRDIRLAIHPVKHLADFNFTATLNALTKKIQLMDQVNERGKRAVCISQYRYLLEGFQLNRGHTFDSVVRHPLRYTMDRETASASVQLPELVPGLNLHIPWHNPLFRFVLALGFVPDRTFSGPGYGMRNDTQHFPVATVCTSWHSVSQPAAAELNGLELGLSGGMAEENTMLLSVGVEMGVPVSAAVTDVVKRVGCGKILGVG